MERRQAPHPTLVNLETFGIRQVSVMAVHPDGNRCYLGALAGGGHQRENLAVVDLDAARGGASPVGEPRWYADSTEPLPMGHIASVGAILPDPTRGKLYLAIVGSPTAPNLPVTMYDLIDGEPSGAPRSYRSANPASWVTAMALHPHLDVLYTVGQAGIGVSVHPLADGEPVGEPEFVTFGSQGKHEIAVSADGKRLYLGTFPETLEIVDLDGAGKPVPPTLKRFDAGATPEGTNQSYFRFVHTERALYRRRLPSAKANPWPLVVWPLDANGLPDGQPRSYPDLAGRALLVERDPTADHPRNRAVLLRDEMITDVVSGKPVRTGCEVAVAPLRPDGLPLENADGSVVDATVLAAVRRREGLLATTHGAGGVAVLTQNLRGFLGNEVSGWYVRLTALAVRTAAGPVQQPVRYQVGPAGRPHILDATLAIGQPSPSVRLDAVLADQTGRRWFTVQAISAQPTELRMQVEIFDGDPAQGGRLVTSLTDTVAGKQLQFLVPGYDVLPVGQRAGQIELLSAHAERLLAAALAVELPEVQRPRRFAVSCSHVFGTQAHAGQLDAEVRTVRALGFNTANVLNWGGLAPPLVAQTLRRHGLTRRAAARYTPPSLFAFDTEQLAPEKLRTWAVDIVAGVANDNGGAPADIIDVKLADEPGLYYPSMVEQVKAKPEWLAAFHTFLRDKQLKPGDFGRPGWPQVLPIGAGGATDIPSRRLFYWTTRFCTESLSAGVALARDAVVAALGHSAFLDVNCNNKPGRWYIASPNKPIFKNPDNPQADDPAVGPHLAFGGFDWMHSGRTDAHTLWSMDSTPDHSPQHCSFLGDLLRSAAGRGSQEFGCYVRGHLTGQLPAGPRYKIMSLIGHGAKLIDVYNFGPSVLFGDGWSHQTFSYGPIAATLGMVGQADALLAQARPARGKVAVLLPAASGLWDPDRIGGLYQHEVEYLHSALVHAGYTVELVDERDVETILLANHGYRALYLTGINLSTRAQTAVAQWVADGGTLAVTPGAATADELNTPTTALDEVLGVTDRARDRFPLPTAGFTVDDVTFTGPAIGPVKRPTMPVAGPLTPLRAAGARVAATFRSGEPAITVHDVGRGHAISYGFFPGWHYHHSADRSRTTRLPTGFGATQRDVVVASARLAGTPRPVIASVPGVEACRLDAESALAIVLLNWTGQPIPALDITVSETQAASARSVVHGRLAVRDGPPGAHLTVPLADVDVLLLDKQT